VPGRAAEYGVESGAGGAGAGGDPGGVWAGDVCGLWGAGAVHEEHEGGRQATLRPQEQAEALRARRAEQQGATFKAAYAGRAGVEGTISQGVRLGALRQSAIGGKRRPRCNT
jgi:Transposase DDE domain